jgi:hypothetical protein
MIETTEKLFRTPQAALVFAFNYAMQQQDRPLADRLASPAARTGKGLSGNDGAGQAGMIRREMEALSADEQAALVARFAPKSLPCSCRSPCCAGSRINQEWNAAIRTLEQGALRALAGHVSHQRLRRKLVEEIFGVKIVLKDLAEACGVHPNTASAHRKIIRKWLCGQKAQHGKGGIETAHAIDGIESAARRKIDTALTTKGIVGDEI